VVARHPRATVGLFKEELRAHFNVHLTCHVSRVQRTFRADVVRRTHTFGGVRAANEKGEFRGEELRRGMKFSCYAACAALCRRAAFRAGALRIAHDIVSGPTDCGMRISDCGLEDSIAIINPKSAFRIPQS
jgi:hypothetical protein